MNKKIPFDEESSKEHSGELSLLYNDLEDSHQHFFWLNIHPKGSFDKAILYWWLSNWHKKI